MPSEKPLSTYVPFPRSTLRSVSRFSHTSTLTSFSVILAFAAFCLLVWTFRSSAGTGNSGSGGPYDAQNPPGYVYKIVPHSSVNPRYTFPIPIPAGHTFVLSELDAKDGYIHLSTVPQLSRTLNRFFANDPAVVLLKMEYKRLSGWKVVRWEPAGGSLFPHLYAQLEGENVESFLDLNKEEGEAAWDKALERAREKGWLQE
ncbi:hypothetical protein JCM11251_003335 [Rhodosporidiobolus azoricus]